MVENLDVEKADVYQILHKTSGSAIQHIKIREYSVVFSTINQIIPKLHENDEALLLRAINTLFYGRKYARHSLYYLPTDVDFPFSEVIVPQRGEKKILLMMRKNLMEHQFRTKSNVNEEVLEIIQKDLRPKPAKTH